MITRRGLFDNIATGLAGVALQSLLRAESRHDVAPKRPHHPPRARRVIMLFQNGGPSQVDLFDPKPALKRLHGQKPGEGYVNPVDVKKTGAWQGSPFQFSRHGECGMELSEVLPHTARHADKLSLIRTMVSMHSNHEQAIWNFNTGVVQAGRPSLGSWVAYGLGTENQNLPAYVAILHPKGLPVDGIRNFTSGWLPPVFHGTSMRAEGVPVVNLEPRGDTREAEARLGLIRALNRDHLEAHPGHAALEGRIASFELAARMQVEASQVLDLSRESKAVHALYGTDDKEAGIHARQLLLARRLIEAGVRYVQVLHQGQPWDTHKENEKGHRTAAACGAEPCTA